MSQRRHGKKDMLEHLYRHTPMIRELAVTDVGMRYVKQIGLEAFASLARQSFASFTDIDLDNIPTDQEIDAKYTALAKERKSLKKDGITKETFRELENHFRDFQRRMRNAAIQDRASRMPGKTGFDRKAFSDPDRTASWPSLGRMVRYQAGTGSDGERVAIVTAIHKSKPGTVTLSVFMRPNEVEEQGHTPVKAIFGVSYDAMCKLGSWHWPALDSNGHGMLGNITRVLEEAR